MPLFNCQVGGPRRLLERWSGRARLAVLLAALGLLPLGGPPPSAGSNLPAAPRQQPRSDRPAQEPSEAANPPASLPRGKKLILKDGSYQLARTYERKGDRVRYYSIERGAWEEIPDSMVDWDATRKAATESQKESEALLERVRTREAAEKAEAPLDIDASLQVAPGVFLPPGEGMFVLDAGLVVPLEQVATQVKRDKGQLLKQVLVPVPVVPTRHRVQIPGKRAGVRVAGSRLEFYLREAPPDPEQIAAGRGSRPDASGPEIELIRATLKGENRQIEWINTNIVGQHSAKRNTISVERWEVAKGVYRFTLRQPIEPGEYALAEILPEGMNLYVWAFGVDASPSGPPAGKKPVSGSSVKTPPKP